MKLTLKLFASTREEIGEDYIELEMAEGATIGELLALLRERYPDAPSLRHVLLPAVNQRYVEEGTVLQEGDEVALLPPVSGGGVDSFRVTEEPLDIEGVLELAQSPEAGAVVVFIGTVRAHSAGKEVLRLEYQAYGEMAEGMLAQVGEEIRERWEVERIAIHHRLGVLPVGVRTIVIAIASAHREEGFAACRYAIDRIKEIVPIWKKEVYPDGEAWVH
jgi:molybdopterin synthase catalytic subunit